MSPDVHTHPQIYKYNLRKISVVVWKIALMPITPTDLNGEVCGALSTILKLECIIKRSLNIPLKRFFVYARLQYNSDLILTYIRSTIKLPGEYKVLVIADIDAFVDGLNFVFGEAEYGGKIAIVYLSRLKHHRREVYVMRAIKEALHEIGHTFMLKHCKNKKCVMSFSNSILDVDFKENRFCRTCAMKLSKMGVKVNKNYIL